MKIEIQKNLIGYAPSVSPNVSAHGFSGGYVSHHVLTVRPNKQSTQQPARWPIAFANEEFEQRSIVERLVRRDPSALEEIYDRMVGRAFGLAYRVLGGVSAAEDVVQDAFAWVWDNSQRLDPERGTVDGLLLTIAHRRTVDTLRARSRRETLPVISISADIDRDAFDLVGEVQKKLDAEAIGLAVSRLTPDQMEVINLAYFGGMTHVEIADHTDLPLGTVKSRLRLALNYLRKSFGLGVTS